MGPLGGSFSAAGEGLEGCRPALASPFPTSPASWRGTVKGPAWLRSLGKNGNTSIKFHGNHFEGPVSGQQYLGS